MLSALSHFMKTLVELIEKQLENDKRGTIFSFLEDGENVSQVVSLREIQKDALKFSRQLTKACNRINSLTAGHFFYQRIFWLFIRAGDCGSGSAANEKSRS